MQLGRFGKFDPEHKKQRVILVHTASEIGTDSKLKWAIRYTI